MLARMIMLASGIDSGVTTWNPAFKDAGLALSNGNLTATAPTGAFSQVVRSTTAKTSGKVYWEVTFDTITSFSSVGLGNASITTATQISTTLNSVAFTCSSGFQQRTTLNSVMLNGGSTASANGEVVSFAFDITNKLLWISDSVMRAATTPWNNSPTANPSTNTDGQALTALAAGPYYAMFHAFESGGAVTANFGVTAFTIAVPTGFTAWDPQ